jgi:hypothetical protein
MTPTHTAAPRGWTGEPGIRTPQEVLAQGLSQTRGERVRITAMEGEPLESQSTYPIERLRVTLESGEQLPVIFKRLQAGEGPKGNRREVLVYQRLLAGGRFGAPVWYASTYDEAQGHYWLFLEDLGEENLKSGDWEDWIAAAQLLGQMHGTYLGREEELRTLGCLGEQGPDYYHAIGRTARENMERAGALAALLRFDSFMAWYPALVAHLVRQPRTLVHGDIFPDNLLLQPGPRIRPIDWESAAIGLGTWDLTRLLDGWGRDKPALCAVYVETLESVTGVAVCRTAFAQTLACCETLNLLWHLGWEAEDCRDAEFVDWLVNELETTWPDLEGRPDHG